MTKKKKKAIPVEKTPFELISDRLVAFVRDGDGISTENLNKVLYEGYIINEFVDLGLLFSGGQMEDVLGKLINQLEPCKGTRMVQWLFKERIIEVLGRGSRREKYLVDHLFVNVLKELLWVCSYLRIKNPRRIKLIGNTLDCLSRLQGVYLDDSVPEKKYSANKQEYLINVLSLKDTRHGFLPYPDQIDPADLETLLFNNDLIDEDLLWVIRSLVKEPFNPYERYHVFKFARDIVVAKLEEKYGGNL